MDETACACIPAVRHLGLIGDLRGCRGTGGHRCATFQTLNAVIENALEFGDRLLIAGVGIRRLQLAQDVLEGGDEVLGL